MKAKIYGYAKKELSEEGLLEMREITLVGPPADLRRIAAFLVKSAEEMEVHGDKFGHNHLQDEKDLRPWSDESTDVIVAQ